MLAQSTPQFRAIFPFILLLILLISTATICEVAADDEDEGDILGGTMGETLANDGGNDGGAEGNNGQSSTMGSHSADFAASSPLPPLSSSNQQSSLAARLQDHQAQQLFSLSKKFQLVCCMGGVPQLSHPELVRNFSFQSVSYVVDRDGEGGVLEPAGCRLFKGSFLLPQPSLLFGVSVELSYAAHVVCKCPELGMGHALDRSCRRLPNCQNNGFRSLLDPRRCFCLEPFFGERCEKLCDRGRRMRGTDGRDYCNCAPFFRGDECRQPICLNGGNALADGAGCECPPHFLGFHCEIDANRTNGGQQQQQSQMVGRHHENAFVGAGTSRFHQRFGPEQGGEMFSRDVSGTVFSLVMIVVLVLSMYLLMKHRMQVQTRYLSNRRADLLGACTFPTAGQPAMSTVGTNTAAGVGAAIAPGHARRVELFPICGGGDQTPSANTAGGRAFPPFVRALAPFFGADGGPPPYAPPGQRVRRSRNEVLPPLPSYEDATKLPALRTAALVVEREEGEEEEVVAQIVPQAANGEMERGNGQREEAGNGPEEEEGIGTRILTRTTGTSAGNGPMRMAARGEERGDAEDLVMLEMEERRGGGGGGNEDWRRRAQNEGQQRDLEGAERRLTAQSK